MNISKDFSRFLQDGFSFQYDYQDGGQPPHTGLQNVTISVCEIGNLIVTSGKLISSDPLSEPDLRYSFTKTISPGHYPVILSVADFQPRNDARIAYAMLRISRETAVKWEVAIVNDQYPQEDKGEVYGYGVDSGTGCFMDWNAAQALYILANPDPVAYEAARQANPTQAWNRPLATLDLSLAALEKFNREFCDKVIAEMENNALNVNRAANWANVLLNDITEANVIAFSSGWGDGGYSSYWGYDEKGNLAALVTDFVLFNIGKS